MNQELTRLMQGPSQFEKPEGIGTVRFLAQCPGNAATVLDIAKKALTIAINLSMAGLFEEHEWTLQLPETFVSNSRDPKRLPNPWSVAMFMNAFLPDIGLRCWRWWDAQVCGDNHVVVAVEVDEWPFAWESLRWLFCGAGATQLVPEA